MDEMDYERFVKVWQAAADTDEVMATMGLGRVRVRSLAYNLRKRGVPLKRFKAKAAYDVEALKSVAKKAAR